MFLVWPITLLTALGIWLWAAHTDKLAVLVGAGALVCTAILGIVWLSRVRAARRFSAVMDAYAEREIDRERRRDGPPRARGVPTSGGVLPGGSIRGR
jgi:hypothetical protein